MKLLKKTYLSLFVWLGVAGILLQPACRVVSHTEKTGQAAQQYHIDNSRSQDSLMNAEIAPYRDSLSGIMNQVIGHADVAFTKGRPEGLLNNFTADIVYEYTNNYLGQKADIALLNYGGLRNDLPQGNITRGNIYELMPFENEVVLLRLKPEAFRQLVSYLAASGGMPISGMQIEVKNKKPLKVLVREQAYDSTRTYTVVTSDYLANGGDNMSFLKDAERVNLNIKLRDLFIDYIVKTTAKGQTLKAKLDGRFRNVE